MLKGITVIWRLILFRIMIQGATRSLNPPTFHFTSIAIRKKPQEHARLVTFHRVMPSTGELIAPHPFPDL
jgi:hypothetical protein